MMKAATFLWPSFLRMRINKHATTVLCITSEKWLRIFVVGINVLLYRVGAVTIPQIGPTQPLNIKNKTLDKAPK